ncbi:MAG: hypothetical protein IKH66_05555, partial [Campylobacter sp.]|nr:hypothetical protein [Campylobacter sp.]
ARRLAELGRRHERRLVKILLYERGDAELSLGKAPLRSLDERKYVLIHSSSQPAGCLSFLSDFLRISAKPMYFISKKRNLQVNLQEKDETNQTENSNETQIDENLQENQSEKEQILAQNDEEMSIDELKEKLEETFKKAFEMSVDSDEKLARAFRNLILELKIAFKDK